MEKENKLNTLSYVFLMIAVVSGILVCLLLSNLIPVQAAEVIPSGDLREAEAVIATWDGSTLYAPEPYFTNSLLDSLYPGETVYYGGYAALENSKIRFRYEIHGEQYDSFFPDQVMCAVFASDGTVLDHRYVKNEFSIYDYAFSRGYLGAWSDNLVYVNTDLGYSFADLDVLGISGRVLYFSVYQNQVDHYYAAQISSGTFSIVDSPDSSLYNILSSELSSAISLFSWNSDTREWDLITANASDSVLNAYPVDKVLRLQGTSALYFKDGGFTRLEPVYFREDSVPPDPEVSPTPTPTPSQSSYIILRYCPRGYTSDHGMTYGYVCIELEGTLGETNISQLPLQGNEALSYAMSNYGVGSDWMRTVFLRSVSDRNSFYLVTGGTYSNIRYYYIGSSLVSTDLAFIKENYSPKLSSSSYGAGYWNYTFSFYKNKGLSAFGIWYNSNYGFDVVYYDGFGVVRQENNLDINYFITNATDLINPSGTSSSNILTQAYRFGNDLYFVPEPSPTPTPDPNATPTPTPSPAPTEPPHVIINWPTSTPMPTPSIKWNPPGSKDTDLPGKETKTIFGRGLDWFRTQMNGGLLAKAFSFLPSEIQWLAWFLIFLLLILAVVRLLIHFGG